MGKTLGSARVAPIVVATPRVDINLDLQTCANIVALLPHDGTLPQDRYPSLEASLAEGPSHRSRSSGSPSRPVRAADASPTVELIGSVGSNGGMQGVVSGPAPPPLLQPGAAHRRGGGHPLRLRTRLRAGRRHALRTARRRRAALGGAARHHEPERGADAQHRGADAVAAAGVRRGHADRQCPTPGFAARPRQSQGTSGQNRSYGAIGLVKHLVPDRFTIGFSRSCR